jgi:hypothetical protein
MAVARLHDGAVRRAVRPGSGRARGWVRHGPARGRADRSLPIGLSIVDNVSGDAAFTPYSLYPLAGDDDARMAVPVVAHLAGEQGTRWKTDLLGYAYRANDLVAGEPASPLMHYHPSSSTSCPGLAAGEEVTVRLVADPTDPGVVPDVVGQLATCGDGRGAAEFHTASWMSAFSRTYTTRADGGTFGGVLPLYPERGWPAQHFAGIELGHGFRVNVGLWNGDGAKAAGYRLALYASDGSPVAEREVTLGPWASDQQRLETMMGVAVKAIPAGTYGLSVKPTGEVGTWAYVSLVDDLTGDPTDWW